MEWPLQIIYLLLLRRTTPKTRIMMQEKARRPIQRLGISEPGPKEISQTSSFHVLPVNSRFQKIELQVFPVSSRIQTTELQAFPTRSKVQERDCHALEVKVSVHERDLQVLVVKVKLQVKLCQDLVISPYLNPSIRLSYVDVSKMNIGVHFFGVPETIES